MSQLKEYEGRLVTVSFEPVRCLHAAECIRGLPQVFNLDNRPWVRPDGAAAEQVAEVVRRCPSGALQYRPADGPAEEPDHPTAVTRSPAGQLVMRGDLDIHTERGDRRETRVMLCGCGASGHQPYCDHSGPCAER
jgi:uncharacterized Fe-S cluster protein YjdI/CDGSH-type Zn-finger protein